MQIADLPRPEPIRPQSAKRDTVPFSEARDGDRLYPFRYGHHWGGWSFRAVPGDDGKYSGVGEFLPDIKKIPAVPGVNGTPDAAPGQPPSVEAAVARFEAKGGTHIRLGDDRLGELADYLCAMPGDGGVKLYCDQSERVSILPGGVASWVADSAAWVKFQRTVRDSGIIAPLHRAAYDRLVMVHQEKVERASAKASKSAHSQQAYDRATAILAQMIRTWDDMQAKAAKTAEKIKPARVSA